MKIRYEVAVEDLIALHQNLAARMGQTPLMRRWWPVARWSAPVMVLGPCVALNVLTWPIQPDGVMIFGLVFSTLLSVVWLILAWTFPRFMRLSIVRQARGLRRQWEQNGVIGPQELELTSADLTHRNAFDEFRMRYSCLNEVVSESGYTFLLTSLTTPLVIPHTAVTEGDPEAFVAALKQKLADTAPAASGEKSSSAGVG